MNLIFDDEVSLRRFSDRIRNDKILFKTPEMSLSQTMNPVTKVKLFQTVSNMERFRNFRNF